jgi:hypothetical protein
VENKAREEEMRRGSLVVACALAIPLVVLVSWLAAARDRVEAGTASDFAKAGTPTS